jgi:two-component system, OmpR family, phosphate regulon response regulator PhoB
MHFQGCDMATILVVDDNSDIGKPLAKLLRHLGYDGHYVTNGEDALRFAQNKMPDLVILDVMMPGMDGMEVLRQLKADPQTSGVKVVMFSAIADEEYRRHTLGKGAIDFWTKASVSFDELQLRLKKILPVTAGN